jgi:hypothetical protein
MSNRFRLAVLLVLLSVAATPTLLAQQAPAPQQAAGPFRGLFGPGPTGADRPELLDVTASVFGAYDGNTYSEGAIPNFDPGLQVGGGFAVIQAEMAYARRGKHISFNLSGGGPYRYYFDRPELSGATPWVSAALSGSLGPRTRFNVSQGVAYIPYYGFGVFPGLAASLSPGQLVVGSADYALYRRPSYAYTTAAGLDRSLSQRSSVSAIFTLRYVDFQQGGQSLKDQSIGATYFHSMGQNLRLRAGYAYRRGDYGLLSLEGRLFQGHDIDVGIDYNRALDRSQRTTFGLSTGSTITVTPVQNYYNVLASAYLNRSLGRTWDVRFDYRRGLQLVEGFERPFFTDTVALSTGGYVGPKLEMGGSFGYTAGGLGFDVFAQGFGTLTGTGRVRVGLARHLALFAEYVYYHYLFDQGTLLPPGVPQGLDRNGIRAGVTVWVPLLK